MCDDRDRGVGLLLPRVTLGRGQEVWLLPCVSAGSSLSEAVFHTTVPTTRGNEHSKCG